MPKDVRAPMARSVTAGAAPYPQASASAQRSAAIWSTADDEILLRARASGLNWQPIAARNFPNKTANACRKRHERLIERRHVEDWDHQKLELLAEEYLACRKEMWEVLANRLGERWQVVEAKCMEKGLKTLQSTARTAQRKASVASQSQSQPLSLEDRGISDHNSDSGIVLCSSSEAEMDVDDTASAAKHSASASWSDSSATQHLQHEHIRSRSLPIPHNLPLYKPPPPRAARVAAQPGDLDRAPLSAGPSTMSFDSARQQAQQRYSPGAQQRGISIQSVLAPAEPHRTTVRADFPTRVGYDAQQRYLA